tara:strand:+ start:511 stop:1077 length:567 start_codon:yes stop_codon:yes gene_type:complete
MKNKSTNKSDFFGLKTTKRKCDAINCDKYGEYLAPKSPNSNDKYLFCLEHIKAYNKRWNYFAGKSQKEIYDFQKNDFFEGKPTRPFSNGSASKIKFQFRFFFDKQNMKFRKKTKEFENNTNYSFNKQIKDALNTLNLDHDVNKEILKKKYKMLVKKYHPDVKNNLLNKDMKIKEINKAYKVLQKFLKN